MRLAAGERLKRWRENAGLTQAALAEKAGVEQARISKLETGLIRMPEVSLAVRIASITGGDIPVEAWARTGTDG